MKHCMQCGEPADDTDATIVLCRRCANGRTYVPAYVTEADVRRIVREELARCNPVYGAKPS